MPVVRCERTADHERLDSIVTGASPTFRIMWALPMLSL